MKHHPDSLLIDALGGTVVVAAICHVSSQAVSKWRRDGIPEARRMFLRLARPEVFAEGEQVPPLIVPAPGASAHDFPEPVHDDRRDDERRNGDRRVRGEQRTADRRHEDRRDGVV